ncbi:hypothetical protein D0864_15370 [Hortaea werneckii]|uniref:Uncharacterized protein n=1 Tax=Hortaea werneckii TaxID=91943 RepID=A0A3M7C178_HORWE|nr:hypothetical protein KC319_g6834 [Hortaea werneckii]KAI7701002.1 hypothetical protein KC322_g8072 [Hortaea werneckii]RMY45795.1 hypothetical protein D0864_15370 [Hortaea werneckii]
MPPILPSSNPNLPDQHIRKRPFQPSITSYFDQRPGPSSSAPATSASTNSRLPTTHNAWDAYSPPILSPPVPEETQASLLSVGMRVRKSVPEGYKTHKTLGDGMGRVEGGFGAGGFGSKVPSSSAPAKVGRGRVGGGGGIGAATRGGRELMPFCGLHKVGGLEVSSSVGGAEEDEEDAPGLTWSQETVGSSQGSLVGAGAGIGNGYGGLQMESKKRTFDEEMEEEMDAYFEGGAGEAAEMERFGVAGRKIAKPRGAVARKGGNGSGGVEGDFEEASFLAPMDVDEEW